MPKIEKHIEVKGEKGRLISKAITDVIREFRERAEIKELEKLEIFVTENPVHTCRKILCPVKLKRHSEMREWICDNAASFSYWAKNQTPVIMLNAQEKIFKRRNYKAIRGLFAHELMHLLNKLDGIEDELEDEAEVATNNIFPLLEKHKEKEPFTRERFLGSLIRITSTTLLFIKDILANSRAMSFGFDEDLYENYRVSLQGVKENIRITEKQVIDALNHDKKHILDNAFLAYVGLNTSWITFKMFHHNIWVKELKGLADVSMPRIIEKNGNKVLEELLKLRSASDEKQIAKVLNTSQQSYFNVVEYFCKKLR